MNDQTELTIIGGGPGGYAAAFLAADLGMNVTLIDREKNPGGVCLYRGCIPSKALLHAAKLLNETKEAAKWGLNFAQPEIDLNKLQLWKESVVSKLTNGLGILSKQRKINYIQGTASFLNSNLLRIKSIDGTDKELKFEKAIIATGSLPVKIPSLSIDSPLVLDSTGALNLRDIPKRFLIIGGGYIGLEMATVYSALGSKVTVVEMMPSLLPGADKDLVNILTKSIKLKLEAVYLNAKVTELTEEKNRIKVVFEGDKIEASEQIFDKVLISVGRTPVTAGLGLENTKINIDERGFIKVDKKRQTDDTSIYAIGDVVGGVMLAHKASAEGKAAVESIAGYKTVFEPAAIPAVVFTDPELAWTGLTETEAKRKNIKVEIVRFPWPASGRAATLDRNDGLTKLIIEPGSERILGMGIVGAGAGELIGEGTLAIEMAASARDVALTIHPHPTLSETIMESAEVFFGQSTHLYRPKRK
jgi:dihydrolipoamide dehydrogenase